MFFSFYAKSKHHHLFRLLQAHCTQWKMTTSPFSGHTLMIVLLWIKWKYFSPLIPPRFLFFARYRSGSTTQVANDVQDRFVFSLADIPSKMTILRTHRLDSRTYELRGTPDDVNLAVIEDEVKISLKCKWK